MCHVTHVQGTVQPSTEKVHQIIARTAIFVCKNGGQSETVLRVKQWDNPTFGFLMPNHHLHAYFKFLVGHVDLLNYDVDAKLVVEKNEGNNPINDVSGEALSLLGSLYGSGEDEDGTLQFVSESKEKEPGESLYPANATISHGTECAESSVRLPGKAAEAPKPLLRAAKEKSLLSKRNRSGTADNSDVTCSEKREVDAQGSFGVSMEKPQASTLPSTSKVESLILEPPSHLKRMVDKIVEFILKKGKEFEAVLIEQDSKNGSFPFLLPSNQYNPYYLKVLQNAQESMFPGKRFAAPNHDKIGNVGGQKGGLSKDDSVALPRVSSVSDIPFDSERKEKFKMVIGGLKKDSHDLPPKPPQQQSGVSVDTVAAILLAATRGLRYHADDSSVGLGKGGPTSSFDSLSSSQGQGSTQKPIPNGKSCASMSIELSRSAGQSEKEGSKTSGVSVAKAIAKTAALAAASEADSSEASLTKEQKQKVERLKRAKMFAAMIKGGTATHGKDLPTHSSEPPDSVLPGLLDSGCEASTLNDATVAPGTSNLSGAEVDLLRRERGWSSVPVNIKTSHRSKSERHGSDDDTKEQKSRKKHRPRSRRYEEDGDDDGDECDHRQNRKKHRSHRSSSHRKDEQKHRKRHSSPDYEESHRGQKRHSLSEDGHKHRLRAERHRGHSKREVEAENEVSTEVTGQTSTLRVDDCGSMEAALDLSKDVREGSNSLVAGTSPSDTTEVSEDLRAKVRAMLLATM
ncbi:splicing factor, suppressor of white-apricot homolog isoform X2 [Macadamia integrifolia]|uniref:splicing factor, suppressor of white-apricot homolog isoform X2 n=1 Tax=Macadamia integrifolia TaxID=60698 RepID=UPI001C528C6B|nr:splicing factor, suppressor of white-apricot homolog isoform X2 [Macadamia integrifolia]XP_042478841.1 splicing factor, suppressor of white-apricot homolog isoform X2 [Macadamia integrifolia]XP_042478842.1 splicing factor, suppressor of white-apricot homolog isoform X2 [Macadamia integrifolia]XP_042478843.1 splicing factor, suppressor of white-apricot homolog isoform X2 [Macadamia integrifolia]XP_042478844.1 splicing factor, suppressor of white-apricot homolog isoform X2 [Macadamia integrifo